MDYKHRYQDNMLVMELRKDEDQLSEINIDNFVKDMIALNIHSNNKIILDLRNKTHFNSTDLGALVKTKDLLFDAGIDLYLQRPSENIVELIGIVGLSDFFKIIK
jgi:anti-anti-sigma factor